MDLLPAVVAGWQELRPRARPAAPWPSTCRRAPKPPVLALLAEHPGLSNAELARRSFVAAPTMLRILDALSQAGLIARAAAPPEQRVRRTLPTSAGEKRLAAASAHVQELEDLLVAQANPDHVE